jgi:hypothetical protein
MQMLVALFGSIRGVFSKTYLLVGLLPAAAVLLSWDWYVQGDTSGTLMREDTAALASALALAAKLLGLGLLFYIIHQPLLRFFESLPGKWLVLEALRQLMVQRQLHKWQQLWLEQETRLWEYTAVTWPERGRGLESEGSYRPLWSKLPQPQEALYASRMARDRLHFVAAGGSEGTSLPLPEDVDIIVTGLRHLMELARHDPMSQVYQEERTAWRTLCNNQGVKEVLQHINRHVYRLYSEACRALSDFPGDTRWLKPTSLGNRIAALDDYAEQRYGIATSTLWARLWAVLPEDDRKGVSDAQLMVHMLLNLSMASVVVGAMIVVDTLHTWHVARMAQEVLRLNWLITICIAMAALCFARVFYLSAVAAFRVVQEHVTRLIDIHRGSLIVKLGFRSPQSLAQEKQFFKDLNAFFTGGSDSMHLWPLHDAPAASNDMLQKLHTIPAQQFMLPKSGLVLYTLAMASLSTESIMAVIERLRQAHQLALPVLNEKAHLVYLIPTGELDRFLAQKASIRTMAAPQLHGLKLVDLLNESPALCLFFQSNFVTVSREASLAEAHKGMQEMPNCLDAFITEDGTKASPLVGWVTNVQIAEAMRA